MNSCWLQRRGQAFLWAAMSLLLACESVDKGVGTTSESDFTLSLEVVDRFVHVGDETPLILRFRRTDNSNLQMGPYGEIVITTSVHGRVTPSSLELEVGNNITTEIVKAMVFTAESPGVAEVRASYRDATAVVKVMISSTAI